MTADHGNSDPLHVYFHVSEKGKAMLAEKIQRAQIEHAHQLATDGMHDILFTWEMPSEGGHHQDNFMTQDERDLVNKAVSLPSQFHIT